MPWNGRRSEAGRPDWNAWTWRRLRDLRQRSLLSGPRPGARVARLQRSVRQRVTTILPNASADPFVEADGCVCGREARVSCDYHTGAPPFGEGREGRADAGRNYLQTDDGTLRKPALRINKLGGRRKRMPGADDASWAGD